MNNKIKNLASALMVAAFGASFTACDDWTEPKSVDIIYNTPEQADPVAYAKYLESLRQYRDSDHKLAYLWFDNPSATADYNTRAQRVDALPDSVDFVVLTNPTDISSATLAEMEKAREERGIKFTYVIDFDALKLAYLANQALATEEEPYSVDFLDFLTDSTATALSYAKNFDGIMIGYNGKLTNHLTPAELTEYKNNENTFIGILNDWHSRNPEMQIDFCGKPQNVANKDLVNDCHVIFLSDSKTANSTYGFAMAKAAASVDGVPTDRFGMITTFTDPADEKVGYMADGQLAVTALADWANGEDVKAAGFTNIVHDYYSLPNPYPVIRGALQLLNPGNM
ncbi:MAG: hypothetical protein K2H74_00455 [Paramuribaculum sp.]|nr:hypothetical protein [Paramuribaculum sp.]